MRRYRIFTDQTDMPIEDRNQVLIKVASYHNGFLDIFERQQRNTWYSNSKSSKYSRHRRQLTAVDNEEPRMKKSLSGGATIRTLSPVRAKDLAQAKTPMTKQTMKISQDLSAMIESPRKISTFLMSMQKHSESQHRCKMNIHTMQDSKRELLQHIFKLRTLMEGEKKNIYKLTLKNRKHNIAIANYEYQIQTEKQQFARRSKQLVDETNECEQIQQNIRHVQLDTERAGRRVLDYEIDNEAIAADIKYTKGKLQEQSQQLSTLKGVLSTRLKQLDKRVTDVQLMEDQRHHTLFQLSSHATAFSEL